MQNSSFALRSSASTSHASSRPSSAALVLGRSSPRAWLFALGMAAFATARPAAAQAAPEPTCDLACAPGTTCQLVSICPAIFCEDPADCPPCVPSPLCQPAACESDADCGADMLCAEQTRWDCPQSSPTPAPAPAAPSAAAAPASGSAQASDQQPEPSPCEPYTVHECTPRWQLPCSVDADCGEGFACEEQVLCSVEPADPYAPPGTTSTNCQSFGLACVVQEIACTSDADCPSTFECADNRSGACSSSSDGQTICEPVDPPQVCVLRSPGASGGAPTPADAAGSATLATTGPLDPASALEPEPAPSAESSATAGGCSLNAAAVSKGWMGLLTTLGLACALGARRKRDGVAR